MPTYNNLNDRRVHADSLVPHNTRRQIYDIAEFENRTDTYWQLLRELFPTCLNPVRLRNQDPCHWVWRRQHSLHSKPPLMRWQRHPVIISRDGRTNICFWLDELKVHARNRTQTKLNFSCKIYRKKIDNICRISSKKSRNCICCTFTGFQVGCANFSKPVTKSATRGRLSGSPLVSPCSPTM